LKIIRCQTPYLLFLTNGVQISTVLLRFIYVDPVLHRTYGRNNLWPKYNRTITQDIANHRVNTNITGANGTIMYECLLHSI